jgi:hypothetical protein
MIDASTSAPDTVFLFCSVREFPRAPNKVGKVIMTWPVTLKR